MENIPAQFSRQTTRLQFPKDVHWGDDITIWISKVGDLAHSMYLRVTWPDDAPTTVQPSTGTAMIDRIELSYKDQLIERIYGENLYMLGDIKIPQAKQSALSNMVGTSTTTALSSYHIPLPFLILKKGIPLIALKEAPKFRVVFNPSSTFTTSLYIKPIQVDLFVDYIYVSKPERDWFVKNELVYLTHSFQRLQFSVPQSGVQTTYTYYTEFVNDVKELFWVIQSDAASNVYDYGNHLVNLQLTLNNQDFITNDYATAQYLHVLQPLQFHTRVPSGNYYMYSFALEPESDQPTGEMNMTNITRQQHSLTLTASPSETRNLRIYAHAYNLFRIKDGDGTTAFPLREGGTISSAEVKNPPPPPPPPPAAVTGLTASDPTASTVNLAWTGASGATSYSIVSTPATTTQTTSGTSYTFTGLSGSTSYTFTVTSMNASGAGGSTTSSSVTTLAPPPGTGTTAQWATRIGAIGGTSNDVGTSISVDGSGNSYVTGRYTSSPVTIYNSDGSTYGTLSNDNNDGSTDTYIVKYNTSGTVQWATRIAGTGGDDGNGISVDSSGNSYVTGFYSSSPLTIYNSNGTSFGTLTKEGGYDAYIVKYNTSGTAQWATHIGGTGNEGGFSISVDGSGNSYVTGYYDSSPVTIYNSDGSTYGTLTNSGFYDAYIVKYNTSGTAQWATRIAGTNYDIGTSISVDGSGNSYVTGYYYSSPVTIYNSDGSTYGTLTNEGWYHVYIVKYNTSGTAQWATHIGGSTYHSYGTSISVDGSGNSYVTGRYTYSPVTIYNSDGSTYGTLSNDGSADTYIVKYNTSGTAQWATHIAGTSSDHGYGISSDGSGNSYVTGFYGSSPLTIYNSNGTSFGTLTNDGGADTYIVKYNTSGTAQWATHIAGTGDESGNGISVDGSGNSYVTGFYDSSPLTIYNSNGTSFGTLTNDGIYNTFIVKYA